MFELKVGRDVGQRRDESNFAEDGRDLLVLRKDFCDCERRERFFLGRKGRRGFGGEFVRD